MNNNKIKYDKKILILVSVIALLLLCVTNASAQNAVLTITIDDEYANISTKSRSIFQANNINGSLVVYTAAVGVTAGCMNWTQINEFVSDGWEITSHSVTHSDLTTLSESQIIYELNQSKWDIYNNCSVTPTTFAYPFGATNSTISALTAQYYKAARKTPVAYDGTEGLHTAYDIQNVNIFDIRPNLLDNTTYPASVRNWINTSIANGEWLILYFHNVMDYYNETGVTKEIDVANLTTLCEYIKLRVDAGDLEVMTFGDAFDYYSNYPCFDNDIKQAINITYVNASAINFTNSPAYINVSKTEKMQNNYEDMGYVLVIACVIHVIIVVSFIKMQREW